MAWSHLQSAGTSLSTNATTVSVAFTAANLTSGSKLIAVVMMDGGAGGGSTTGVADGHGNNFGLLGSLNTTTGNAPSDNLSVWALDTPVGDVGTKPTITATIALPAGGGGVAMAIQEVSGLATGTTTSILDGGALVTKLLLTGTSTLAVPTFSSTAASEYLLQVYADWGSGNTIVVPTGYSGPDGANASGDAICILAYKNSTGGSETGNWTSVPTGTVDILLATAAFLLPGSVSNASVSVPVLAATAVLPAPTVTIQAGGSVSVPALAATTVLPAPALTFAHIIVAVPPLAATAGLPAPSAGTGGIVNASVAVSALAATTQFPAPSIGAGFSATVSIPAVAGTARFPVASASQAFGADPLAATTQLPAPALTGKVSVTVSILAVAATTGLPAPSVTFGFPGNTPVPVPALAATTGLTPPGVAVGVVVPISALAATTVLPAPSIFGGFVTPVSITVPALAVTAQLPAPTVTIGSGVLVGLLAVTTQFPAVSVVTVDVALPIVAWLFTPPEELYVPRVPADPSGGQGNPGWRLMQYFHPTHRGVNVYKLSDGTYPRDDQIGVWPTTPTVPNDAISSTWGVGALSPIIVPIDPEVVFVFYGGHSYLVDDDEADRLTAAGYGPNLVGVNQDQIDEMTEEGSGFDMTGALV